MALLWSTKRRWMYGGGVVLVIAIISIAVFWSIFYKSPTCTDGTKNGDETGVDCGGSCKNLCTSDALNPAILWAKVFNISGDVYNAVAYVENPNLNSSNAQAKYQFTIYDEKNKPVTVREGYVKIPRGKKFAIFETGIVLKNSKAKSADFKFLSYSNWVRDARKDPDVSIQYNVLESTSTTPKLVGTVTNQSLVNIPRIELVVFALDGNENVVGASRTYIDNLYKDTTQDFVFTWQKPFEREATLLNVIYRVN